MAATTFDTILLLDELTTAPPIVQAAAYQLVLDRALGEYVLPDGWSVAAASNLDTDRAVVNRMSTALASRFSHLQLAVDMKEGTQWAVRSGVNPLIIAFVRFRPELLHNFDPHRPKSDPASTEKAYACPR